MKLTERNIQEAQRVRELSDLPEASAVTYAQSQIQKWRAELQQVINDEEYIRAQIKTGNLTLGTKYGIEKPFGLIIKPIYDGSPTWLQVILTTAAQYYYDCKVLASHLSPNKGTKNSLSLLPAIIERAQIGVNRTTELLSYIEKMVPEWYLECPASLNDSDFMDR